MYRLAFYVPKSHLESVKNACFKAGAGKIGHYDQCCWQTQGTGQFRALKGSNPAIGNEGTLETIEEYKVELVCEEACISETVNALTSSHPYETPAYEVYKLEML